MSLPMENQEPRERLRRGFHSPAQRGLRSAIGHENNVFRLQYRVRSLARQYFPQIDRGLLSFTTLLIRADDSRVALRSGASESFAQGQSLQDRNLLIRFQGEPAGLPNFANHIYNPCASDLDDVARMNQWIAARIGRLEKIFQVHLHGTFRCRSIAVEGRGHAARFGSGLHTGRKRIRHNGVIYGWVQLRGPSCSSQNDDGFSGIVGQTFCERENLQQRLASADLENAGPSYRPHHRNRMALHLAYKHTHMRVLHVVAVKKFLEDKFQSPGSQSGRSNRSKQGQRNFTACRNADFAIQLLGFENIDVEYVVGTDAVFLGAYSRCRWIGIQQFLQATIPIPGSFQVWLRNTFVLTCRLWLGNGFLVDLTRIDPLGGGQQNPRETQKASSECKDA